MDTEMITVFLIRGMLYKAEAELVCRELEGLVSVKDNAGLYAVYTADKSNMNILGQQVDFLCLRMELESA